MPRIRVLPRSVIAAIAAGEVIERPAIVVKELIENALDAGATQIQVHIENSGLSQIRVTDNGQGMDEEDLLLSFQRHTTSKVHSLEDLNSIETFGFRGEALASMASVSTLTIQSRTAEQEVGHHLKIHHDEIIEQQPMGLPVGTTIIVEDLFANVPARRKFLKNVQTELRHIIEVIQVFSLSHPEIGLVFSHAGKTLLSVPKNQTFAERIRSIFGHDFFTHTFVVPENEGHLFRISGILGTPQIARRTTQRQYVFVNRRHITHLGLSQTIKEAYGSLIDPKSFPFFALNLEISPTQIDVNVHPRKETLRFLEEAQLLEHIRHHIAAVLEQQNLTYQYGAVEPFSLEVNDISLERDKTASAFTSGSLKEVVEPWKMSKGETHNEILQIHNTYLVAATNKGIVIFDQHAAHERILYEQFKEAFKNQKKDTSPFTLPKPVVIECSLPDAEVIKEHLQILEKIGFSIEEFGKNSFKVTQVPAHFQDRKVKELLNELIDDLSQGKPIREADSAAERTLAYLACRNAVKAGDSLHPEQRQELIEKLLHTPNHATCPHGRPTTVTFSKSELEKLFKRK